MDHSSDEGQLKRRGVGLPNTVNVKVKDLNDSHGEYIN